MRDEVYFNGHDGKSSVIVEWRNMSCWLKLGPSALFNNLTRSYPRGDAVGMNNVSSYVHADENSVIIHGVRYEVAWWKRRGTV